MTRSILELERSLQADQDAQRPTADRLVAIRHEGRGHRRRRRLVTVGTAGGVVALVAGLGWALGVGGLGSGSSGDQVAVDQPAPTTLSPLAKRALREIPGAKRVSASQVLLPDPNVPTEMDEPLGPDALQTPPIALPASAYVGVTLYPAGTFPDWLHDGVQRAERADEDADGGYPVGSLAEGVVVDEGTLFLSCVARQGGPCTPTVLHRTGADWFTDWGMGTDDFLEEGADMEVFGTDNFVTGRPSRLWLAGIDGAVARADFVLVDGSVVPGTVAYDTVVAGDSMMWADVPGELAKVVAYAADGSVVEDHELRPCDDPVDCEVR